MNRTSTTECKPEIYIERNNIKFHLNKYYSFKIFRNTKNERIYYFTIRQVINFDDTVDVMLLDYKSAQLMKREITNELLNSLTIIEINDKKIITKLNLLGLFSLNS